jgi:hypothetical protein
LIGIWAGKWQISLKEKLVFQPDNLKVLEIHSKNNRQITPYLMMVRPAHFGFNVETAANNAFQDKESTISKEEAEKKAIEEFDAMVRLLRNNRIHVLVVEDSPVPPKPDAIFPNNWISFHENGTLVTYPMFSAIRREERREEIIEEIEKQFVVDKRYSFEYYEDEGMFLEGTGSMLLDRPNRILYACLGPRTNIQLLDKFCLLMGYKKVVFSATDAQGLDIYHTNVMMSLGKDFAVVCFDSIKDKEEKKILEASLEKTAKYMVSISLDQMHHFAGNMLQVSNVIGEDFLVMSSQAYQSLDPEQILTLHKFSNLIHSPLDTIESLGGGSARCMLAEIFLPKKPDN